MCMIGRHSGEQLGGYCMSIEGIARSLGVNARTLARWRRDGVPWHTADELAVKVGSSVWVLWPEAWATFCESEAAVAGADKADRKASKAIQCACTGSLV